MIGERTRKPWGWTRALSRQANYHLDGIEVDPWGYCSVHRHAKKVNVFHVLGGSLYVKQFSEQGGSIAARHCTPGETFVVPPGIWHTFHAQNGSAQALEIYLPGGPDAAGTALDEADIERHQKLCEGGVASYGELSALWREAFNVAEQYIGR